MHSPLPPVLCGSHPQAALQIFPYMYLLINFIASAMQGEENGFWLTNFLLIKSVVRVSWQDIGEQETRRITPRTTFELMENPAGLGSTFRTFPRSRQGDLMPMWAKWSALHAKAQLTSRGCGERFTHFPIPQGENNHITSDTSDNWNMALLPNTRSRPKISRSNRTHSNSFLV